ncbi:MAG: NAD-dependent succinate-semialdehyde dehydrogenase [Pseudonocardia sp.]|uniref:NAD-dependent succinate-semialdehyde dehydrogenase n=1 Tax=unclassified Pseudonocardia TaxID=2619320 RepID=UPI000869860E|nr:MULTISPECIES: NAD-dependent succinate-semialdehyde dehydrogenase [unclassified Pseudonocardia]MBN9112261.1 NAD-dependent succinate-semialdehyde dehydrogenase [Pseudonocardia sp.]ODU28455.1 MAG: NAD-dependent succinate-semialdehyde dehydrogenase [Pseudonocardia sp. SCN 72-51]ODU99823.1 MAG: NAD-dependent succinate-semialdehyde dehydrogenase [Pseudonocardia sp. SCN 73-27]
MSTTSLPAPAVAAAPTQLLVAGEWREPRTAGAPLVVTDPATGSTLAEIADAAPEDAVDAVDAAATAFGSWSRTAPRYRGEMLRAAYDLLMARAGEFASVITSEMGKPLAESRAEVAYGGEFLRWYAEEAVRATGTTRTAPDGTAFHTTIRQPVGPSLLITPWNFPLAMLTRKIAPALAAGCTVVVKPAEETPLTALLFADLLVEVGVPPGVVNVLTTSRPGQVVARMLDDRRIRKLSFTGSTEVGRRLLAASANGVLRTSMELGGNAPFIVFADADLDAAVDGAVVAKLRNGGQSCVAANRFIVDRRVGDEFVAAFADRLRAQVVGHGADPATTLGPMIDNRQRDRAAGLVRAAIADGATPVLSDDPEPGSAFLRPVLLTDVRTDSAVWREEVFAPVASVRLVDSEEEALRIASDTDAGLVGFAWSRDAARLTRAAHTLECGMVGLNRGLVSDASAPFGGMKQSGLGREGSDVGLHEYLETKYISHPFPPA